MSRCTGQQDWRGKVRSVRVNDLASNWAYLDIIAVVGTAGAYLDTIVLPKTQGPEQVAWLDVLLRQVEANTGLDIGRIGIEAQIEDSVGLGAVAVTNAAFVPRQDEYDRAELVLDAYVHHTSEAGGRRGAVMLGHQMIDEASRKQALRVSAKGRAAGLERTVEFQPG